MGTFHGVTTNYGTCMDGPWKGKNLAHAGGVYNVAVDNHTQKPIPAVQGPSPTLAASIRFARYVWQPGLEAWKWDDPVGRSETGKRE